ncbi:MerR HTH family regulatory protein [Roseovarius litoreus]|uniref:MerR HTH family regulatory protein n=1 Tax=Roseovarius litoreus TaxID=1155722 RepID=A0A1M7GQQ0_9RHOB|nr:MerR family transcriptional regulator [Roseovarius litoreus]SHM18219.1 MerR HTH family regulatory protein [Roseovarius litoreus]
MAKSADAFRTISEVADWLETPAHVLRFWESKFSQVKPVKRAGGRRYYRPADMELLGGIKKLLHDDGMTIKGVQKILREEGVRHVAALSQPVDGDLEAYVDASAHVEASEDRAQDSAQIVAMQPNIEVAEAAHREPAIEPAAEEVTSAQVEPDEPLAEVPETPAQDSQDSAQDDMSPGDDDAAVAEDAPETAREDVDAAAPVMPSFSQRRDIADTDKAVEAEAEVEAAVEAVAEDDVEAEIDESTPAETAPEPPAPPAPKPAVITLPDDPADDMAADAGLLSRLATLTAPATEERRHRIRTLMARLREVTDRPENRRDS